MIEISRIADSTIKGFLYQFNLTLSELLSASDDTIIQVEGIIEDVDIINEDEIFAIQCKYHEEQDMYSLSMIYKPVLQMLKTYISTDKSIDFILYAHFPSESNKEIKLTEEDIKSVLETNNIEYISQYICKISPPVGEELIAITKKEKKSRTDKEALRNYYQENPIALDNQIRDFINNHLTIKFAESYDKLEEKTKAKMVENGIDSTDVDEIFFPNAIHKIAQLSTNADDEIRKIKRKGFLDELFHVKKTAISRWTRELKNYKQLITSRKNQLSTNLNQNNRKRLFLIDTGNLTNFNEEIVVFLKDYVEIYCHKPKLHEPALICLSNSSAEIIADITARLYKKSVEIATGNIGNKFFAEAFMREPERKVKDNWMQFKLRLCYENEEIIDIVNDNKPDDMFVVSDEINDKYDLQDINVEFLDIKTMNELKYLLKIIKEVPTIE